MQKYQRWIPFAGFIILSITVTILLGATVFTGFKTQWIAGIVSLIVLAGALITIISEGKRILADKMFNDELPLIKHVYEFIGVVIGGVLACIVCRDFKLGAVVGASLVGIVAYFVVPKYAVPVYCGAFVGMTSNALLFTRSEVAIASVIAGIIFVLSSYVFGGFGGKLGTIAFISTIITSLILGREFIVAPIFETKTILLIILVALIATPLTYYFNVIRGHGAVLASAFVGLLGGLILPIIPEVGGTLAVVAICASFAGMSNKARCPHIWMMVVAGLFIGIIFVYSTPIFGGAGGKLGTIAFGSVMAIYGFMSLFGKKSEKEPLQAK
jgi:hypothetical protein